jgi:hypothetical protein
MIASCLGVPVAAAAIHWISRRSFSAIRAPLALKLELGYSEERIVELRTERVVA